MNFWYKILEKSFKNFFIFSDKFREVGVKFIQEPKKLEKGIKQTYFQLENLQKKGLKFIYIWHQNLKVSG